MRIGLALLAAVVVLIALWWIFGSPGPGPRALEAHVAPAEREAPALQPNVEAHVDDARQPLRSAVDVHAGDVGASIEASDTIRIRSSTGLTLRWAEVERPHGTWTLLELQHGLCERSVVEGAKELRAPGHVAVVPQPGVPEIVLDPDALLRIHAEGLRECVRALEPQDVVVERDSQGEPILRPSLRRAIAWGWLSDDEWLVAASPDLLLDDAKEVDLDVYWRDGRRGWIYFRASHGARERWEIPCELRVPGLPLRIQVRRPEGLPSGRLSLALLHPTESPHAGWRVEFPWGFATGFSDDRFVEEGTIEVGSDELALEFAPTTTLVLAARDKTSSAYGRMTFVHDGSPRTLDLRPPFELRGRLVSDATSAVVPQADLTCELSEDGEEPMWGWQLHAQNLVMDAEGNFLLRGPVSLLLREELPLEVPSNLSLRVEAPGFEPFERVFETHHAPLLDCGEIRLIGRAGDLVLAPGHGLVPAQLKWFDVVTSGDPYLSWNVRDARLEPDGALAIFLLRDEKDPRLLSVSGGQARAWPDPAPKHCLVYALDETGPRAFELDDAGRYAAVEMRQHDIDFDCTQVVDRTNWHIGWVWRGLPGGCAQIPAFQTGEIVHIRLQAPAEGADLFWSTTGLPPTEPEARGGLMPIDSIRAPIVLR
ncbi:MAG TPA: carboxypeptidase-like regulatory domain-containing protein [Planctomycetota bacterium]|nr:carboxypeptidase-like regulatory domain-containing protein [Planctomycetota bacterium]